ncbi:MAG: tetratricopeptide repeat protein, partial [Myxococcales bacterium]|nr:tetratricopeptide repeat protein [Myxococcales bacterium]
LIGDWVQRDLLVATGAGFELRAEGGEELPDDVRAICQARLRRALGEHAEHDGLALELAALLGAQIDETEWRSCCEASGLDPSPDLLESLGRQGLLDPALGTWRFAHGVVRESLLLGLSQAGREAAHHRLIADVLRNLYRERTPDVTERIAHHHEGGGELHDAQALLLRAASGRRLQGEYERAVELMRHREALLDRLGIAAADPLRAEGDLAMAKLDLDCDRLDEAARRADDVEHRAADQGWTNLAARATLRRAEVSLARLEHPEALALFGRALQALDALGDLRGQIEARAGMAEAHYYLGNRDQAAEAYEENLRIAQQLGDELTAAEAHWGLGYVMLWQGRLERAHHHLDAMRELLTRRGGAYRLADAYNGLGEVARLSGRLAEAERFYREALRLNDAFGTRGVLIRRINILLCRIERDAPEVVEVELLDVLREADRLDNASVATMALAALLRCLAMRQAWDEAPPFLARFVAHQEQRPFIDGDLATNLSYVARLAAQAGRSREAETAVGYAREIWTKLGRHAELRALADL